MKKYLDAGIATLSTTGDFSVVAVVNPHFNLTDRVTIHRADVQVCRTPDQHKAPPGTLSRLELIELPEVKTYCGTPTKWVIAHWGIHPETQEKIEAHPWEVFICHTDSPTATLKDFLRVYDLKKKEWTKHGCFTLKEYQERTQKESRRKVKKVPAARRSCSEADLENAKLAVLETVMPHTVQSIRAGDGRAAEYYEHESHLPLGELDAVKYAIAKAYASHPEPPPAKALSDYVYQQTGKRYSGDAIKKIRERMGLTGGRTGPPPRVV